MYLSQNNYLDLFHLHHIHRKHLILPNHRTVLHSQNLRNRHIHLHSQQLRNHHIHLHSQQPLNRPIHLHNLVLLQEGLKLYHLLMLQTNQMQGHHQLLTEILKQKQKHFHPLIQIMELKMRQ